MDKYCSFGTSTGNASTMRRASWEFHWFSTASTAFQSVARSAYPDGAWVRSLEIMMLLERINELGTTVLVVTHAKELVNRFSKRVVAIENGRIISDETGGYYNNETTI